MERKICKKEMLRVIKSHVISRRLYNQESLDENVISSEVNFVFNMLRDDFTSLSEINNGRIKLKGIKHFKSVNSVIKYIEKKGGYLHFEIIAMMDGGKTTKTRFITVENNGILKIGNKEFKVQESGNDVLVISSNRNAEK